MFTDAQDAYYAYLIAVYDELGRNADAFRLMDEHFSAASDADHALLWQGIYHVQAGNLTQGAQLITDALHATRDALATCLVDAELTRTLTPLPPDALVRRHLPSPTAAVQGNAHRPLSTR